MKTVKFGSLNLVVENLSAGRSFDPIPLPEAIENAATGTWRTLSHDFIVAKPDYLAFMEKMKLGEKLPDELKWWARREFPEFNPDRLELVALNDSGARGGDFIRIRADYAEPSAG